MEVRGKEMKEMKMEEMTSHGHGPYSPDLISLH